MRRLFTFALCVGAGFAVAKIDDHVHPTGWGWAWRLTPAPNFYGVQTVKCLDGTETLPPWHVYVLHDYQAPVAAFLQERGH